jgi:hypothetical protein
MAGETVSVDVGPAAPLVPGGIIAPASSATKRNPFGLPRLPKATGAIFDQIRAKAKQALPAAPAALPPSEGSAPAATPWVKYGLIGTAVFVGYKLLSGGKKRHG